MMKLKIRKLHPYAAVNISCFVHFIKAKQLNKTLLQHWYEILLLFDFLIILSCSLLLLYSFRLIFLLFLHPYFFVSLQVLFVVLWNL